MLIRDFNADFATCHGNHLKNFADANFPIYVKNISITSPLPGCNNCAIAACCNFKVMNTQSFKRRMWRFNDTDFVDFRNSLSQKDWQCLQQTNIDNCVELFTRDLLNIALNTIPNALATVNTNDKPWYNTNLRRLRRKSLRFYNIFKINKDQVSQANYKVALKLYQDEIKLAKSNFENSKYSELVNKAQINSKKCWTLLKTVYKSNDTYQSIPPLENNNTPVTSDKEKANLFNDYFCSISSLDATNNYLPKITVQSWNLL